MKQCWLSRTVEVSRGVVIFICIALARLAFWDEERIRHALLYAELLLFAAWLATALWARHRPRRA
jgi:uncharacterized membrane protein